ncbi:MAG: hypothetical protein A2607_00860 [Candidatus Vogelbacteria bacterium RIFOXYD1_FULL_42_15]|uniref:Uncharacterized protein n=1 Tax=Candidatus Vogelbacteria bacterium RIFOXYD1_FULL_42_15 TaxID=1802437 RepID=A0A1G2QF45_9BACT|nr:MAG: hypothetical protein A2607_00860 [Candidatus Vogelbacteria bacterium RIFOXYD1_FULL_42_15]
MDKEKEKKYYQILPAELKEIYDDPELLDQIYEICLKNNVRHLDQVGTIQDIVYDLILGLLKPADFVPTIVKEAGIGEDIANLITHEINEQLLKPIRDKLMAYHQSLEHGQLPANTEKADLGVSSMPYPDHQENSQEQLAILDEIENPSPATVITRNVFQEKKTSLVTSEKTKEQIDIPTEKPAITNIKKPDPYREQLI